MTRLGDVCQIKYGKDHKGIPDGRYPVYGSGGIMRYAADCLSHGPSVLIPRKGSLGNVFYAPDGFWTVDTLFWTQIDSRIVAPKYLYYLLKGKHLELLDIGTAVPSLSVDVLNEVEIELPSVAIQNRVISIVNPIDKLIRSLSHTNGYLSAMASTEFSRFQASLASSAREGSLSDLLEIRYGKDHKRLDVGTIPVYGSGGLMRKVDKQLYDGESVLIPRKGSLNNVMYVDGPFWTVDTMFYSVPKCSGAVKYAYEFLNDLDLAAMNSGSAVPSMTIKTLDALRLRIPSEGDLRTFDAAVSPLFSMYRANAREAAVLAAARDTLLPKLMSGEIDVSKVELPTQPNSHLYE